MTTRRSLFSAFAAFGAFLVGGKTVSAQPAEKPVYLTDAEGLFIDGIGRLEQRRTEYQACSCAVLGAWDGYKRPKNLHAEYGRFYTQGHGSTAIEAVDDWHRNLPHGLELESITWSVGPNLSHRDGGLWSQPWTGSPIWRVFSYAVITVLNENPDTEQSI